MSLGYIMLWDGIASGLPNKNNCDSATMMEGADHCDVKIKDSELF